MHKTIVVGAGPVGIIAAIYAAARGDQVEVYEKRKDPRSNPETALGALESVNLTLSERGIKALEKTDRPALVKNIVQETCALQGRVLHLHDDKHRTWTHSVRYDAEDKTLLAIDRMRLVTILLDEVDKISNICVYFEHCLERVDLLNNTVSVCRMTRRPSKTLKPRPSDVSGKTPMKNNMAYQIDFDFLLGTDGINSSTRSFMMRSVDLNFQQEYSDTLWCGFHVESLEKNQANWVLDPTHIHIWPGGTSMLTAIPSINGSYTFTLFGSVAIFADLSSSPSSKIPDFFEKTFPGVMGTLIPQESLIFQYQKHVKSRLRTVKCSPYHHRANCALAGDAAHAMVPFYGQGTNAGFEDITTLYLHLDAEMQRVGGYRVIDKEQRVQAYTIALQEYSDKRAADGAAICDMAVEHYKELNPSAVTLLGRARRGMDNMLMKLLSRRVWIAEYPRVAFSTDRYSDIAARIRKQYQIIMILECMIIAILLLVLRYFKI